MADQNIEVKKEASPQAQAPGQGQAPARTQARAPMQSFGRDPFAAFRSEIDRMFEQFRRSFGFPALRSGSAAEPFGQGAGMFGGSVPAIDFAEDDKAYHLTAELPGLGAKDVEVTLSGDTLTISGEKREEREEKEKSYHVSERHYGSFRRSFTVPQGVDRDRIAASFRNGVLALTLPKSQDALQRHKRIEVKAQ